MPLSDKEELELLSLERNRASIAAASDSRGPLVTSGPTTDTRFPVKLGTEAILASAREAAAAMPFGDRVIAGAGLGVDSAATRIKQATGNALTPEDINRVQTSRALQSASPAVMAGKIALDVGATAPFAPTSLIGNVAVGAGLGALEPTLPGESTVKNSGAGAAGGGLGFTAAKGIQGLVGGPVTQSHNVQKLISEGIIPTPGRAARDAGGIAGRITGNVEDAAGSWPIVGQVIGGATERTQLELARAALKRATVKGADLKGATGTQGVERAQAAVGDLYDAATARIPSVVPDSAFTNAVTASMRSNGMGASRDEMTQAAKAIKSIIEDKLTKGNGAVTGEIAKDISSQLGGLAANHENKFISAFYKDARDEWKALVRRNAPDKETAAALDEADRAYANLVRVEGAVNRGRKSDGAFTGGQLMDSVYATDRSVRHRATAGGEALMQDLAQPAATVLSPKLADSGTASRMLHAGALLGMGGAGATNEYFGGPGYLTALALSPVLYSRAGSRYMLGDLPGQAAAKRGIGLTVPAAGVVGADLMRRE